MFRKRRSSVAAPKALATAHAFGGVLASVEEAKRRLVEAAPAGRSPGVPLAEALAGFEEGLREAAGSMPSWRVPEVEEVWSGCWASLEEARRRAEVLRLGDAPEGYEGLYGILGDLMAPLEAFAAAIERFRTLGA